MKKLLILLLKKHPRVKRFLKRIYFKLWSMKTKLKHKFYDNQDGDEVIWIDPEKINQVGVGWGNYKRLNQYGKVKAGDWDLNTMCFEDLDVYQAFYERFILDKKWEDTHYFYVIKEAILSGQTPWGMKTFDDMEKRFKKLDILFYEIKDKGYKTKEQLAQSNQVKAMDEITVRIGRNGEILFENGRHRLSIAKILGLTQVPVMVTWRHKEWNNFKLLFKNFANNRKGGYSYQEIDHIDLHAIKAGRDDSRTEIIRQHLPKSKGSLLDIGANLGYFCHKFEDDGFRCFAVERNYDNFYFLNKYKNMANKNFTAINFNFWDFKEKSYFDVVLALSIFHWSLKDAESFKKMECYLKRLKTKMMFFEPHNPEEAQMKGAYKNFNNEEFVRFICDKTGLKKWECIGKSENARSIFKIW